MMTFLVFLNSLGNIRADNANGVGGALTINTDSLELNNEGSITALTTSETGQGGIINLNVDGNLLMRDNSEISARAESGANGGIINLSANSIVAFPNQNNDIVANALQGNGGNINITTEALLGLEERSSTPDNQTNDIDANSNFGLDGNVSIFTPDVDLREGVVELSTSIVEPEQTVAQACQADRVAAAQSNFTIKGRGGIMPEPGSLLNSNNIYIDGEADSTSAIPAPIETAQGKIQPARGIKVTEDGTITLTAYRTDNAGQRIPQAEQYCN